jgi:pimeloyl-ACP methyl ester carboxylesterase
LLLLHGALGSGAQLRPLAGLLEGSFDVHLLDFEGHGAAPLRDRPFRIEHFAENVRDYLDERGIERAGFFGYSMGGYVACTLALSQPEVVEKVATLGTKFYWDEATAERECGFLDPRKIEARVPHFARALAERHSAAGWVEVLARTADLLRDLAKRGGFKPEAASRIGQPVRVMLGDRDSTVTLDETAAIYHALAKGELEVLPATRHEIERVSPERLAYTLREFFG